MLATQLPFEKFLDTFAPGALFLAGVWYLHRPFLAVFFPYLAGGTGSQILGVAPEWRIISLMIVAVCIGTTIRHLSDMTLRLITFSNNPRVLNTKRLIRCALPALPITLRHYPRVRPIELCLGVPSPRREAYRAMLRDWCKVDGEQVVSREGKVLDRDEADRILQHLRLRLRTMSGIGTSTLDKEEAEMTYAASLLMSSLMLLPIAALSFVTNHVVLMKEGIDINVPSDASILLVLTALWGLCNFLGYTLARKAMNYHYSIPTAALHAYAITAPEQWAAVPSGAPASVSRLGVTSSPPEPQQLDPVG